MDIEFITSYCPKDRSRVFEISKKVLSSGISSFQFSWVGDDEILVGSYLRAMCHEVGVPFIVNNKVDLACHLKADGVHLGPTDMCIQEARKKLGKKVTIGYSVNTLKELDRDYYKFADYLGVGPVFFSQTNKNTFDGTININTLPDVLSYTGMPITAIGGIKEENIKAVKDAGINKIAVIGAYYRSSDINKTTALLKCC